MIDKEKLPKKVRLFEVGPRDGLQNEKTPISTEDKYEFIKALLLAGYNDIEATSFVRPDRIPQLSDASELFPRIKKLNAKAKFWSLIPNLQGLQNAQKVGCTHFALFSATSDEFTKKNINVTVDESFTRMQEVVDQIEDMSFVRGYISTVFGCPYQGDIDPQKVLRVIERFIKMGVTELSLGDTIGVATPLQVQSLIDEIQKNFDLQMFAMHFHDTRGMALANVLTSLSRGIAKFDSSAGGLGGCPYAKGSSGNLASEDLIYLLNSLNIEHGVDLDKLIVASAATLKLLSKEAPSKYHQAVKGS